MATLKVGTALPVQDVPGRWTVWSQAAGRGQWFLVPADDAAREVGQKYLTVRVLTDKETLRQYAAQV